MSSGRDWTHHWLLSSMGPSNSERTENEDDHIASYSDEGILTSPVASVDLDRDSPMACGIHDDDDTGPPSIETQPPDNSDIEVSAITSTWISSGDHYEGSHSDLRYSIVQSDMIATSTANSAEVITLPGLDGGEFNAEDAPVYGPSLPGPYISPSREVSPVNYGDISDASAISGVCGLRNLGNTCFMAAGLQCLINTPPIAQYFFNHNLESNETAKLSLAGCFSQLTHKIWSGKYSCLRPSEFKDAFGAHWRDFRDYRQHDCQEFMTLLLEALRKQMPLEHEETTSAKSLITYFVGEKVLRHQSCTSSLSSRSSSHIEESRESKGSISPSPPQSPQDSPFTLSPPSLKKQIYETRSEMQEENIGLDSGPTSPKSSVSSSSVDVHLTSLRLRPIPEEIKNVNKAPKMKTPSDEISIAGTMSCHDEESITSDISDAADGILTSEVAAVRRYNTLFSSDCDMPGIETAPVVPMNHCLSNSICDSICKYTPNTLTELLNPQVLRGSHNVSVLEKNRNDVSDKCYSGGVHLSMVKLEDILKETKTSNVNVLAKDNVSNNEFLYDSEKYARVESNKLKNSLDNLNKCGLKRIKEVNLFVNKKDNSLLNSTFISKHSTNKTSCPVGKNTVLALNKRIRLEEKNVQYEMEKSHMEIPEGFASTSSILQDRTRGIVVSSATSEECKMAEESWNHFVGDGKNAVVDTFYGQFKSSLVCSVCGHTSIKFDPFGTLSVPLPHANEIQIPVIYVPFDGSTPTRSLITLFKVSTVHELKLSLLKLVEPTDKTVVIAEVFDNHIARTVEDTYLTKFLNYTMRSIYAYELEPAPFPSAPTQHKTGNSKLQTEIGNFEREEKASGSDDSNLLLEDNAEWQCCNICLEELCQTDLKSHVSCEDCALCDNCIEMSYKHHGGQSLPCPVCHTRLYPVDLIPVAKSKMEKPKARILRVAVVFRVDTESDDNNKRGMRLIGHPRLISLPSRISARILLQIIDKKLMRGIIFSLLLVDGRGYNCSRCLFSSHCRGCEAITDSQYVMLQAGDTLCVRFRNISVEQCEEMGKLHEHSSMDALRPNEPLTLYDCLRAFTQSETLEDSESWYCPKCELKQLATKTISVWKYPPYLIIHLERFLFHGTMSTKVDDKVLFPIDGLDLSDFVAGERQASLLYNLYSCVCHMGVAQAGHYTALVRSPVTGNWHYFNDDCVTRQKPRDEEYSTSYLLFYHKQGTKFDLCLPKNLCFNPPKIHETDSEEEAVERSTDSKVIPLPSVSSIVPHATPLTLSTQEFYSKGTQMQHKDASVGPNMKESDL